MSVVVVCPTCGTRNHTDEGARGHDVECAFCFARIHVPSTDNEAPVEIPGFQILESIGTGSNGRVYKAIQLSMGREVALKVIPRANLRRKEDVKRFMNEVRLLARMDHSHIVAAYEAGETDDYYYLAMTFVDGKSLDSILDAKGFLPEAEALLMVINLAEALEYAWERHQVLHRDIKPSNIMVDQFGKVKLMDLGISKTMGGSSTSSVTAVGMVVGTPYYMSPEQAVSTSGMDCRSDIYSLGATLFEMVTGTKPFDGETPLEVMGHHRFSSLPSPRSRNRKVSVNCATLIESMMAKNMNDRYQTWQELILDLKRVAGGLPPNRKPPGKRRDAPHAAETKPRMQPVPATPGKPKLQVPVPGPAQQQAPAKSNFMVIFSLLVLLVGVLAVSGFLIMKNRQKGEPQPPAQPPVVETKPPSGTAGDEPPPDTGPETTSPGERWEVAFAEAQAFEKKDPDRFSPILKKYQLLVVKAPDGDSRERARKAVAAVQHRRRTAIDGVINGLAAKAVPLATAQQLTRAAAIYTDYHGPFAGETAADRQLQSDLLAVAEARNVIAAQSNRAAVQELIGRTAALLIAGRLAEARRLGEAATQHPALGKLPAITGLNARLDGLAEAEKRILASFEPELDTEIKLQLNEGPLQVIVKAVNGDTLDAQVVERRGETVARLKRTIRLDELAPAERARRLGKADDPAGILTKGILALMANHPEIAEKAFIQVEGQLADGLLGQVRQRQGESANPLAEQALNALLTRLGVHSELTTVPEEVLSVWEQEPSAEVAATVATAIGRYQLIYGGTAFGTAHRPVSEAICRVASCRPELQALRLAKLDTGAILKLLAAVNPGLDPAKVMLTEQEFGYSFIGAGNPELVDLSPLAALPIVSLDVTGTKVENLSWLRAMPLSRCVLARTQVSDLKPLRGLPLTYLDLSYTPVFDVRPLAGLPLRELNLEGSTAVLDCSALAACTRLERLCVPALSLLDPLHLPNLREAGTVWQDLRDLTQAAAPDVPVVDTGAPAEKPAAPAAPVPDDIKAAVDKALVALKAANPNQKEWASSLTIAPGEIKLDLSGNDALTDLTPLAGLPVTHLVLDRTGVTNLEPLARLPLVSLSLAKTGIRDLSALRGSGLTHLSVAGCPIKEFYPLLKVPLTWLDASGTEFREVEALQKMPLTWLDLSGTPVRDFERLAGKEITHLALANTAMKDLEDIAGLPLDWLDLRGTKVLELDPLQKMALTTLLLDNTRIRDLRPLTNLPLVELRLFECDRIGDFSPLLGCSSLERLTVPAVKPRELEVLRQHPTLKFIESARQPDWKETTEAFWKQLGSRGN